MTAQAARAADDLDEITLVRSIPDEIGQSFVEYFRCPDDVVRFRLADCRSTGTGFFRFGADVVGYGDCLGPKPASDQRAPFPDVRHHARVESGECLLPFNFSEVVDALRRERYPLAPAGRLQQLLASKLSQEMYYFLRPHLSIPVRRQLQKIRLRGWDTNAFPRWPVDVTVESLMNEGMALALRTTRRDAIPFIWFWPDGAPSCTVVTHDVETSAGYRFCGHLMDIDDEFGVRSAFQIIPAGRYRHADRLVRKIRDRGFEVNVHDLNHDGRLFHNRHEFLRRARLINDHAVKFGSKGFRAGAMYRNQDWFEALGFSYDMSVPNVAHLEPQGGGCCTVMPFFVDKLLELPLTTLQDYSLFHILSCYSIDFWKQQIDAIRKRNGFISLLTHPDYLIAPSARDVYFELLHYVSSLRSTGATWLALPGEVDSWWRARHEMRLVRCGDRWRIEGTDSHRARIAYAKLKQGRVIFDVESA